MHRGFLNTTVLALTKWFQKGHKSKVVDGKRIFPPEEDRDKDAKKIRREIRRLPPPMCDTMEVWLDGLMLYGEADWFLAVMGSMSDGDLHEELVRLAQVEPDRRVSTVRLLHSTPWMAAFHRFRGRGRSRWSQAFRWLVALVSAYALWWLISWPYRAIEGSMRFFMERGHMEPETINLWAPQMMKLLILILVLFAIYGIFFKKAPEEREVRAQSAVSDDDKASETTEVKKKETKTTTKPADWDWLKPVLVFAGVVVIVLVVAAIVRDWNGSGLNAAQSSRATCQFAGGKHLADGVGCVVNISIPKEAFPVCVTRCSDDDKLRWMETECASCWANLHVSVNGEGEPIGVQTVSTDGAGANACAKDSEEWMSRTRWKAQGFAYRFYYQQYC